MSDRIHAAALRLEDLDAWAKDPDAGLSFVRPGLVVSTADLAAELAATRRGRDEAVASNERLRAALEAERREVDRLQREALRRCGHGSLGLPDLEPSLEVRTDEEGAPVVGRG